MTRTSEAAASGDGLPGWMAHIGEGTEMGRLVREHDWASTPLGPPTSWPSPLRNAVRLCLSSRFPMIVLWGEELIEIYNDGYRPILGDKHPTSLGASAKEVWVEIWEVLEPLADEVMGKGGSTWDEHGLLVMERHGYPEEAYFTWSYSPIFLSDGSVGGIFDVVTETTAEVLAERRLACLSAVTTMILDAPRVTDVAAGAISALARWNADIVDADVYLRVGDGVALVSTTRADTASPVDPDLVRQVSEGGPARVIGGDAAGRLPAEHVIVRLGEPHDDLTGVLVAGLNPRRAYDADYRSFIDLVASAIGAAIDAAYRRAVELDEYRQISDTLQEAMLRPASDLPTVAARYLPATGGLSVGGDWYDVIDVGPTSRAIVVGDCVGHDLEAATAMGQMRSATRAMLLDGLAPDQVLERLDRFAARTAHAFASTVVCAVIDREAHTLTYASAGHLPPLLVGTDRTRWLDEVGGVPLAVHPGAERRSATTELQRGDVVVLYTDGLVERRGEVIDAGLQRLEAAARQLHGEPVNAVADGILRRALSGAERFDDVVLVVKHLDH
ncbi:PP2C family protein-serine/threonine phosphatase [Actinomarinicola tropica]|uniref:SpoIIE family protein phosphatase n=1 Tax=Actinomarinicola tropica TaxID=2789776 RepID=A0A5Q2RQ98_9ACTN|nr:PP2C family protein-serine/threonine phosphatase [Actinomarinicola tropica]QGG96616.1 SpoIIE family protein phosphatase [Actinomarinicola tropica]